MIANLFICIKNNKTLIKTKNPSKSFKWIEFIVRNAYSVFYLNLNKLNLFE